MFFFDVLDDIVNKYNNVIHRTIKMKPIDVTSHSYAEQNKDPNVTKPNFKVGDHDRISKYKNIFVKGYTKKKKFLLLVKLRIQFRDYLISYLNGEKIAGIFCEKNCKKQIKTNTEQKK